MPSLIFICITTILFLIVIAKPLTLSLINKKKEFVFNYERGLPEDIIQYCKKNLIDIETWLHYKKNRIQEYKIEELKITFNLKDGQTVKGYVLFPKVKLLGKTYKRNINKNIMVCYDDKLECIDYENIVSYKPSSVTWGDFYNIHRK